MDQQLVNQSPQQSRQLSLPGFSSRYKRESGAEKKKSRQPCIFISMREKGNAAQTWGKRKERGLANQRDGNGSRLRKGKVNAPLYVRRTRRDPRLLSMSMGVSIYI